VRNVAVNGSGLLSRRFFDWSARLAEELARATPDVVVVCFIGNYTGDPAGLWVTDAGTTVESIESPDFGPEWGRQTDAVMAAVAPTGARVVLVLPPSIPVPAVQAVVDRLRVEYQQVAARWSFVTLVDAAAVLTGPEDRAPDGVHLSARGEQRLADAIAAAP
jgi:lysophospholipase L1-like esterase